MENSGNSVQPRENCNKQSILVRHSDICVKQLLTGEQSLVNFWHGQSAVVTSCIAGVDGEWPLMKVVITFTFCCDHLWKNKFMALEKPGKLREFFLLLCGTGQWPPCLSECIELHNCIGIGTIFTRCQTNCLAIFDTCCSGRKDQLCRTVIYS